MSPKKKNGSTDKQLTSYEVLVRHLQEKEM